MPVIVSLLQRSQRHFNIARSLFSTFLYYLHYAGVVYQSFRLFYNTLSTHKCRKWIPLNIKTDLKRSSYLLLRTKIRHFVNCVIPFVKSLILVLLISAGGGALQENYFYKEPQFQYLIHNMAVPYFIKVTKRVFSRHGFTCYPIVATYREGIYLIYFISFKNS